MHRRTRNLSIRKETTMKPLIRRFLLCILLLLLSLPTVRAGAATDPSVLRATLKNGLRVVIVHNALAPVVTTQINYLVGGNETPAGFPGMAHAQEHMMFRGSPGLSATQLSALIASMGGEFNAETQQTVTRYFFTVPTDDLDLALHIGATRMRGVLDSEELWEPERGAIEQEVARDLSSPMYVFYTRLLKHMYAGTPYAHDPLGTRPSFQKTTGSMLKRFYDAWYAPNNAILVIVGKVDPEKTLQSVKRLFGDIPSRPLPPRPEVKLQPLKPVSINMETDLSYGLSVVAYRLPGFDDPDFAAGQVLADVLDSQRGNLYALVPQGRALFAGFDNDLLPKAGTGYALAAFPPGGDGPGLVAELKKIISDYLPKGIPADLVEAAKRHEIADAEFSKNSVSGLADAWSQALAVEGRYSPKDDIEAIRKVTVKDVNRVARKYLVNDTALTAVLTPRPSEKPVSSKGFGGKESFTPKAAKAVPLPSWARKARALPGPIPPGPSPEFDVLPNGLRLILIPSAISPTVSLYGQVRNNPHMEAPKGKEGVDQVLGDLFSYGTTTLDRLPFQKALDEIAANESAGTDFSLQVLSDHFDRGVQLLADNLLHPALPKEAFEVVRKETAGALAGKLKSPAYLAHRALREGLFPKNDPSLRQATPETVSALTLDDVRDYYRKVFRPDLTTIVVIGHFDPQQAKTTLTRYLGGWQQEGPPPETDLPPVPPNRPATSTVPDPSRVQDEVTLAQTLGLTRSNPDFYPLEIGRSVLSGAFYATRLYHDLREKAGLVYTVEAILQAGKTRSAFAVFYACDPGNVSRARTMVERDLRQMQTTPVSEEELRQAKILLLRQIPLSRASFDGIAGEYLHLIREDLPLYEPVTAARRYRKTTAEQVRKAFDRWIRPADFVQVTQGPPPR
jgi:zinc protease